MVQFIMLASRQQALISAPVQFSSGGVDVGVEFKTLFLFGKYLSCHTSQIDRRVSFDGRSQNHTASHRSARVNSGGRAEISFEVAITKTSDLWSLSQVRKVPNNRVAVPL